MKTYLSYILDPKDPVWPGEPNIQVKHCTQIEGDCLYNSFLSILPNHCGTHYDGPWHFNPEGVRFTELPMEYFWFDRVAVADAPKKADEGVTPEDLEPFREEISQAKLLLIKTGFCFVRREQPQVYQNYGPYLTPETAEYLTGSFPNLNTVGFDFLSVGSPANDLSARTHQILLGRGGGHFVTAIEDMDLSPLYENNGRVVQVIAAPLRIAGVDSSQVCVIAQLED